MVTVESMDDALNLEDFLPYRLSVLSHTISTTIAKAYETKFGISIPEWRVIAILGRFPGLSAVEVADRTMLDKVAVSRAVTRLIKNGRIDRDDTAVEPDGYFGEWAMIQFSNPSPNASLVFAFYGLGVGVIVDDE